jgi:uncharacterized protein (TIGR03084 family)
MDVYESLLRDLAAEHADLDGLVSQLSDAEWAQPTPAQGWTIADSILHLALTDEAAAIAATDSAAFQTYRSQRSGVFDGSRGMPPVELVELWRSNRALLLHALAEVDARQRITWFGPPMSAMSHATARLMETWAHGQDIVDALGVRRMPTARLKHIAHLGVRTRAYSYTQHGLTAPDAEVRVELLTPDDSQWTWGSADLTDRVTGPALDFCLVVVQRRHLDDTDLVCEGPHAREWLLIAQAFAGKAGSGRQPGQFRN